MAVASPSAPMARAPKKAAVRKQVPGPKQVDERPWEKLVSAMMQVWMSAAGVPEEPRRFAEADEAQDAFALWNRERDDRIAPARGLRLGRSAPFSIWTRRVDILEPAREVGLIHRRGPARMPRELRSEVMETRAARAHAQPLAGRGADFFTIPNALTMLRILLVPVFLSYYFADRVRTAALVFAVAASTDVLDGLLARLLRQRSAVGAILDPFADKLLGLASLIALVAHRRLPLWLLALSLLRDAVVVALALWAMARGAAVVAAPSRVGKYATFFAYAAVILALIWEISYAPWLAGYVFAVTFVAGECLVVAAVQYALRFVASARSPR